jgi:hypothetical protein
MLAWLPSGSLPHGCQIRASPSRDLIAYYFKFRFLFIPSLANVDSRLDSPPLTEHVTTIPCALLTVLCFFRFYFIDR